MDYDLTPYGPVDNTFGHVSDYLTGADADAEELSHQWED